VLGFDHLRGQSRVFRVDRVEAVARDEAATFTTRPREALADVSAGEGREVLVRTLA
jgi:predicted DNA-binding transcriptional regulator YafY